MNAMFALFGMGGGEIVLILVVVLLLFGAKRLPELARGLGQGIREFKKASNEVTEELERAADEAPPPPRKQLPLEGSETEHSVPQSPKADVKPPE